MVVFSFVLTTNSQSQTHNNHLSWCNCIRKSRPAEQIVCVCVRRCALLLGRYDDDVDDVKHYRECKHALYIFFNLHMHFGVWWSLLKHFSTTHCTIVYASFILRDLACFCVFLTNMQHKAVMSNLSYTLLALATNGQLAFVCVYCNCGRHTSDANVDFCIQHV